MRSVTEIKKVKKQAPEKPSKPRKKTKPKVDLSLIERVLEGIDTNARDIFLPVLRRTQEVYGFIPREAVIELAKRLKTTPAHLYGVATFYDQFSLAPQGRNVIRLCTNMACNVNGAETLLGLPAKQAEADKRQHHRGRQIYGYRVRVHRLLRAGARDDDKRRLSLRPDSPEDRKDTGEV